MDDKQNPWTELTVAIGDDWNPGPEDHFDGAGLNELLTITKNAPDEAGASCAYRIRMDVSGTDAAILAGCTGQASEDVGLLRFQRGPRKQPGSIAGLTNEAVLAVLIDRMRDLQAGPYACPENAEAADHLARALAAMQKRVHRRAQQGVLGTNEQHETPRQMPAVNAAEAAMLQASNKDPSNYTPLTFMVLPGSFRTKGLAERQLTSEDGAAVDRANVIVCEVSIALDPRIIDKCDISPLLTDQQKAHALQRAVQHIGQNMGPMSVRMPFRIQGLKLGREEG